MDNEKNQAPKQGGFSGGRLIKVLSVVLAVLIIVIIILLLRSCGGKSDAVVLEPDYPAMSEEPSAVPIENEPSVEAPTVSQGGGSVTLAFMDNVVYSLSSGKISLFYQNPSSSTHNVVVQVILTAGSDEYLLSQSGVLKPGYQVTSLQADSKAPQLSQGGYSGKLRLRFYDPETGERAIVDTDIPCTISVRE